MANAIASGTDLQTDLAMLLLEERDLSAFLRGVLERLNRFFSSDLAFIAIIEGSVETKWVTVRDPENQVIGAESGEWHSHIGRLKVGSLELPRAERSIVGVV